METENINTIIYLVGVLVTFAVAVIVRAKTKMTEPKISSLYVVLITLSWLGLLSIGLNYLLFYKTDNE